MRASLSLLSKTELFLNLRQRLTIFAFLLLIFTFSLFNEYQQYKKLTQFDDYITTALVQKQKKKNNYWVLKLQSIDGFSFYTTSRSDFKDISGYYVDVRLFIKDLDFISYLKGFYSPSVLLSRHKHKQKRYILMKELQNYHNSKTAPVFSALFFAGTIPTSLRNQLSALGINHLLAISGFHLGVLSLILFFVFRLVYRPFQERFFPYRNSKRDISIVVFAILFSYVYFLDFTPSLLRAFAMSLFAYILYDRGVKILSFSSLFLVISFLIALWPKLLFSLGFWFSVAGIFFIFLFLHHMKELKTWQSFLLLHLWVYIAMLPVVHAFYGSFSVYQLASPFLTMLFILFYPLELFIHLIGQGSVFDPILEYLLNIQIKVADILISFELLGFYIVICILAVWYRFMYFLVFLFSLSLLVFFLYRIA